jgi:uncharacterized protein with HEPN domain
LEKITEGALLARYPHIPWRAVIGVRNVMAHGYFDVDSEQIFEICNSDILGLIGTVKIMIKDVQDGVAP